MSRHKFLIFMCLLLAIAVFAWTCGDVLAEDKNVKPKAVKGKVTRDDVFKYLGKVTPSEQKAAQKRARLLGLLPGIAGRTAQTPTPGGTQ